MYMFAYIYLYMYMVMSCSYDVNLPDSSRGAHPNDLPWRTAGCRTPDIFGCQGCTKHPSYYLACKLGPVSYQLVDTC